MSVKLDNRLQGTGTKFKIYPQPAYIDGFEAPETVWLSIPAGEVRPGPADDRIYVIDAIGKSPYRYPYLPPHRGAANPPVQPDAQGHFDHLDLDSRSFKAAHMYAVVRRVLDIFEDYFDREIAWSFTLHYPRLELVPLISWDNAQSGYGFLEFGFGRDRRSAIDYSRPYCLNFDVLAHELGHTIVFSEVGYPNERSDTPHYGGFHESIGDLVALVASLHFNLVVDKLLERSAGNLFSMNELSRIGELSAVRQIRTAFNYERMSTVGNEPHDLSQPLTGAIFDVFVEIYQKELVRAGLITQDLADRSYHGPDEDFDEATIQAEFQAAFDGRAAEFKAALLSARDTLGLLLVGTLAGLSPHFLTYSGVGNRLLAVDQALNGGAHQDTIRDCFAWREIGLEPGSAALRCWRVTECALSAV